MTRDRREKKSADAAKTTSHIVLERRWRNEEKGKKTISRMRKDMK